VAGGGGRGGGVAGEEGVAGAWPPAQGSLFKEEQPGSRSVHPGGELVSVAPRDSAHLSC
jgi:hypothetical protein